jgi:hypothetical protein
VACVTAAQSFFAKASTKPFRPPVSPASRHAMGMLSVFVLSLIVALSDAQVRFSLLL